ncbi:MAG: sodium:solute symporter family protein [Planctomycetota bacterium]|nr:MAG: sodium:solute symporter family protein [Planctomycetota bacterium]REK29316.1 MAG: sodium:solute symporter family protein [Planctomycetota bacterium]REK35949.1 MAG: sodium:solute symporter family protein [Planctomycetota bacterium]
MPTHFSLPIDGSIVGVYLLITMAAGLAMRRYVGSVEDFIVAGREMKLYLGIASLAATEFGIVTGMYTAQLGYKYGFAGATPGVLQGLVMFLIGWTGFCVKPLRDSGALTIPELFEKRFGPRVRWAAGVVIVLGGLLNMGVFLRMGGEFLVLVAGFNPTYLELVMTVLLLAVAVYTILGGMLSVLVTDFLQFIIMSGGLLAVTLLIFKDIGWTRLVETVETHHGAGGFNPFLHEELGWEYVAFQLCLQAAAALTWQTTIARVLSAKDTQTGRQVYTRTAFFFVCRFLVPCVWGIAALTVLTAGDYAQLDPETQNDVSLFAMPLFLGTFVPIGLTGLLVAAMIAADMSTDSSYMLTWGSVIYNDILAPFGSRKWSARRGLLWNRMIVAGIGLFLLGFGLWYPLKGDLWTYLGVTGTIYLASMSTLLIACCYWKRANNWGAAAAIITGAVFPLGFLVMEQLPVTEAIARQIGPYYSGLAAYLAAALAMVAGSLLKPAAAEGATV